MTFRIVAAQIKYWEGNNQKDIMFCLTYFPSDSVEMLPPTKFKELVEYSFEKKKQNLVVESNNIAHRNIWGGRVYVSISRHRVY